MRGGNEKKFVWLGDISIGDVLRVEVYIKMKTAFGVRYIQGKDCKGCG